jgi:hypothetical protein
MVPRTGGYAYDANAWDSSIIQGPFSVAPCQTFRVTIRTLCIAVWWLSGDCVRFPPRLIYPAGAAAAVGVAHKAAEAGQGPPQRAFRLCVDARAFRAKKLPIAVAKVYVKLKLPPELEGAAPPSHWPIAQAASRGAFFFGTLELAACQILRYRFAATDLNSKATWFGIQ